MALENLAEEVEKAEKERAKRYPLLDVVNNLEDLRKISEDTVRYAGELYPDLGESLEGLWEVVIRTSLEFSKSVFKILGNEKTTKASMVSVEIENFMKFGIEYGTTEDGDKDATFNPVVTILGDMVYNNDNPTETEKVVKVAQYLGENDNTLENICKDTQTTMKTKYGVIIEDWRNILRIFIAFAVQTRAYLIDHKDDNDYGMDINFGNVLDIGIERYGMEDEKIQYCIQFAPHQIPKLEHAKNDDNTEKTAH